VIYILYFIFSAIYILGKVRSFLYGRGFASGMYFYKVEADNFVQIKKMLLMK